MWSRNAKWCGYVQEMYKQRVSLDMTTSKNTLEKKHLQKVIGSLPSGASLIKAEYTDEEIGAKKFNARKYKNIRFTFLHNNKEYSSIISSKMKRCGEVEK